MATLTMQLMMAAGAGWLFYQLIRAMGYRELAEILRLACWALGISFGAELLSQIGQWLASSPIARLITWIEGRL